MTSKQPRRPEVRSDLRFEIYGPNYVCYHVCLNSFGLLLNFQERRKKKELVSTRVVGFAATKKS